MGPTQHWGDNLFYILLSGLLNFLTFHRTGFFVRKPDVLIHEFDVWRVQTSNPLVTEISFLNLISSGNEWGLFIFTTSCFCFITAWMPGWHSSSDQFKCLERRQFVTFSDRTLISYINILYLNSPCFLMSECDEVDYIWAGLGWGRGDQIKRNYFTYAANIKIIQIYRPTSSPHFSHFYFPLQGNCKY